MNERNIEDKQIWIHKPSKHAIKLNNIYILYVWWITVDRQRHSPLSLNLYEQCAHKVFYGQWSICTHYQQFNRNGGKKVAYLMEKQQNYSPCCRNTTKSNIQYTKCDKTFMCKHFCGIWLGAIAANSNEIWFFVRSFFFHFSRSHSQYCLLCCNNIWYYVWFPRMDSNEKATSHCYCDLVVGNSKAK